MERGYRFRVYPNAAQTELIHKTFGCCRWVYNHYLAERGAAWSERKENMGYNACSKDLTGLKKSLPWLCEYSPR